MKKLFVVAAIAVGFAAPAALADNGLKVGQNPYLLEVTKCSNSGGGNGAERLTRYGCRKNIPRGEDHPVDQDPGNSGNVPD